MIAQSIKRCQTSFQGKYKSVLQLCAHKPVETEWFVQGFTPHSPQLPKASFTGQNLLEKGRRA